MKNFNLPENVQYIIDTIEGNGYQAWCVGGCVRDIIMNKKVNDYDIASNCPANKISSMFDKVIDTGIKHGTVTVVIDNENYEVTQYRIDGDYLDCRHPQNTTFTNDFSLDLSRRDFTMNAIGYHPKRGMFDPFDGQSAIKDRLIMAVGEPDLRFKEDALRILRAFRFSSTLNFNIELSTKLAAVNNKHLLNNISRERIREELFKLLGGENPSVLTHLLNVDLHLLNKIPNNSLVRFSSLCVILNKNAYKTAVELKTDRFTRKLAGDIYDVLVSPVAKTKADIKKQLCMLPQDIWSSVLQAQAVLNNKIYDNTMVKQIIDNKEPYLIKHLDISSEEKKELSKIYSGQQVKEIFDTLVNYVIQHPENNKKIILKEIITQISTNS